MAKTQQKVVNPPVSADRSLLTDFAGNIQDSFRQLFQAAHDHLVLTVKPSTTDGAVQTVSIVDTGTSVYLIVKTNRGWFKSSAFTAL